MKDKPKYFSRYYVSHFRREACYKIQDRKLHMHIALVKYREAATLIAAALNLQEGTIAPQGLLKGTED